MNEKLAEILKDEAVVKELLQQETAEDAQKFLASKGVEISIEDLENLQKAVAAQSGENEEMDDSQLEQVAGGAGLTLSPAAIKRLEEYFRNNPPRTGIDINQLRNPLKSRSRW
ncbi:MAG: hypothetical protein IJT73_03880 [Selenomonadaceae bacterium]|nr:hypothetical protein [Selenomonadaceae bacterium]